MAENKTVHLRNLTEIELESRLKELNEELFNLRFRNSMKQLEDPLRIRETRRAIARVRTLLHENAKGISSVASSEAKK